MVNGDPHPKGSLGEAPHESQNEVQGEDARLSPPTTEGESVPRDEPPSSPAAERRRDELDAFRRNLALIVLCVACLVVLVVVGGYITTPSSNGLEKLALAAVSSFMTLATAVITFYFSRGDQ